MIPLVITGARSEGQSVVAQSEASIRAPRVKIVCFNVLGCVFLALTACKKIEDPPRNNALLATDIHVSVAHHQLLLPVIALSTYRGRQSFTLTKKNESSIQASALEKFMQESIDPKNPKLVDRISLQIDTYGWDDRDSRIGQICPMLTRKWAHSVCDNPWAVVQQSLPHRIEIVDLSRLTLDTYQHVPRCADNSAPHQSLPTSQGATTLICEEQIFGGKPGESYVAAVRIEGDLGAVWSIARNTQAGETGEARLARQGKAIASFVQYGLGAREDFSMLYDVLCELRAPGSPPGIHHQDCGDTARQ